MKTITYTKPYPKFPDHKIHGQLCNHWADRAAWNRDVIHCIDEEKATHAQTEVGVTCENPRSWYVDFQHKYSSMASDLLMSEKPPTP